MADLTFGHDTTACAYIKSRATLAVALNISMAFDRFCHAAVFH